METSAFELAIVIVAAYDECLLRNVVMSGYLGEMAKRDPYIPSSLKAWYAENRAGKALPPQVPTKLLERFASAATRLSFLAATRRILEALGIVEAGTNPEKAHSMAIKRFLAKSLAASEVHQVSVAEEIEGIEVSRRNRKRTPQRKRKSRREQRRRLAA